MIAFIIWIAGFQCYYHKVLYREPDKESAIKSIRVPNATESELN